MSVFRTIFEQVIPQLVNFGESLRTFLSIPISYYFVQLRNLLDLLLGSNILLTGPKLLLQGICDIAITVLPTNMTFMVFLLTNFTALLLIRFVRNLAG